MELCARCCRDCRNACADAMPRAAHLGEHVPELTRALQACRELLRLTEESLETASPAHRLLCYASAAACTICGRAFDALATATKPEPDPVMKEVGDSCWIAASLCKELVGVTEQT